MLAVAIFVFDELTLNAPAPDVTLAVNVVVPPTFTLPLVGFNVIVGFCFSGFVTVTEYVLLAEL